MRAILNRVLRRGGTRSGAAAFSASEAIEILYEPQLDGHADPGEVVWGWVPFEDNPNRGKDRPLLVIGRRNGRLVAVPLTSKFDDRDPQAPVGTGPWDRWKRPSYAQVDRLLEIGPGDVRREGAILPRDRFDGVVDAVRAWYRVVG